MTRTLLIALAVTLVLLAAAQGTLSAGSRSGQNWTVWAGEPEGMEMPKGSDALRFFPSALQIHAGDSVTFRTEEGHSITSLGPRKAREFQFVVPDPKKRVYGRIDDSKGAPFWFVGKPRFLYDLQTFVARAGSTTLGDGAFHQRVIADNPSFLPGSEKTTTFIFPKVGTYEIVCMLHYPAMRVTIVVRPRAVPVQSQSAVERAVRNEFEGALATGKALAATAPPSGTVFAGVGKDGVELSRFFPDKLTIRAGTTVTFVDRSQPLAPGVAPHNELFGDDERWIKDFFERSGQFNRPGLDGQVGPELIYGTQAPGRYVYDGSNHGNGFLVTPMLGSFPASFSPHLPRRFFRRSQQITFPKRGDYHFYCEVHGPKMAGEIVVK